MRFEVGALIYSAAYRIDASIRPRIRVNYLERADHRIFDITFTGVLTQCICSVFGYSWMYALTRRPKLSILAALPPFLLNILYTGTHSLCSALDVFVGFRDLWVRGTTDFVRHGSRTALSTLSLPSSQHSGSGCLHPPALYPYSHGVLVFRTAWA